MAKAEIEEVREAEEQNYQVSLRVLGDTVSLADDVVELYRVLAHIAAKSPLVVRDEYFTAMYFLLGCQYQLTIGALAGLRGHLTDALRDCRLALEQCGFAARVQRTPALALTWLNAGTSETAYAKYLEKFKSSQIFPPTIRAFRDLRGRYDQAAKVSHPSIYRLSGHGRITKTTETINVEFRYFGVRRGDRSEPARTFLWTVDSHFRILRVFEDVFAKLIAHDRAAWNVRMVTIDAKLDDHKTKWKGAVMSGSRGSATGFVIIP